MTDEPYNQLVELRNYLRQQTYEWLRGTDVMADDGGPFLRISIASEADRPKARRVLAACPHPSLRTGSAARVVVAVAPSKKMTVEDALELWDSPFADNEVARLGFRAGWQAVFDRMKS